MMPTVGISGEVTSSPRGDGSRMLEINFEIRRAIWGDSRIRFDQSRSAVGSRMTSLDNMVRRVDFGGNWSGRDNVGNWVTLALYDDGTMNYSYGRTGTRLPDPVEILE